MRPAIYLGDHTVLAVTHWGDKIYVDTRDTSLAPHLMLDGMWEEWVTKAFLAKLSEAPGATVIDVGANFGWYTLLACRFASARVYAFEPNVHLCELLARSLTVNGYRKRCTLLPAACGSERDMRTLVVDPQALGGASLVSHTDDPALQRQSVLVVRLDDEIENDPLAAPIILKIDVEGFEPEVLGGAPKLLDRKPTIFLEHHRAEKNIELLAMLKDRGFCLQHVRHSGHLGPPMEVSQAAEIEDAETILCTP